MDDDADSGSDSFDSEDEDSSYGDDSGAADTDASYADTNPSYVDTDSSYTDYDGEGEGEGDDDGASWLMGDGDGYGDQGSGDGYTDGFSGSGDETDGLNTQDYGSDDGQAMGKPIDPCKGYRAICQKHPAWAGECRDSVDKAQADADAHNKALHGGTPYAGVLD